MSCGGGHVAGRYSTLFAKYAANRPAAGEGLWANITIPQPDGRLLDTADSEA